MQRYPYTQSFIHRRRILRFFLPEVMVKEGSSLSDEGDSESKGAFPLGFGVAKERRASGVSDQKSGDRKSAKTA